MKLLCEITAAIIDDNGYLLEYKHLIKHQKYRPIFSKALGNEVGRLAHGMPGRIAGTDTISFIRKEEVPQDRMKNATYTRIVSDYRPTKEEKYRVRVTMGDIINYPGDCSTPTADLLTVKLLLNSTISTLGARFFTLDIKYFYLNTP